MFEFVKKKTVASESDLISRTKHVQEVAAKSCSEGPGTFKSSQQIEINFPAGYKPNPQIDNHSSPNVGVACGAAKRLSADQAAESGPTSVTYTVTATKE